MRDKLRRFGWMMLVLLFVFTGLGVGVYGFWQATHESNQNQPASQINTLKGTKLANFTPLASVETLQAIDTKVGTGKTVQLGDTVKVLYEGALASTGIIFDDNNEQPAQLPLASGQVIAGWVDGVPGMKVGGTRRLLIPAAAAYGANP